MSNHHFTVAQIEAEHEKVKSGADFPRYIQDITKLGLEKFETYVTDSHTQYFGADDYQVKSDPQYENLVIAGQTNKELFSAYLKNHQQGNSDYFTFCRQCAETGIEKWVVDLTEMTCTYYDQANDLVLVETIPGVRVTDPE